MMRFRNQFRVAILICLNCYLWPSNASAAEEGYNYRPKMYKAFRPMSREQLQEARAARDAAGMMLHECRKYGAPSPENFAKYGPDISKRPRSQQEIRDYQNVISAYQDIVKKYEGTEIAAYCQLSIFAAYSQQNKYAEAIRQAEIASKMFAGTPYEEKAYYRIGITYAQSLEQPSEAIKWFEKIAKPKEKYKSIAEDEYRSALDTYVNAQNAMAGCEIRLGEARDAAQRCNELSREFPQYKEYLENSLKFRMDIARTEESNYGSAGFDSNGSSQGKDRDLKSRFLEEIRSGSEAKSLMQELIDRGVDVISLLLEEYKTSRSRIIAHNIIIIKALQAIGTNEAKSALLKLAITDDPTTTILEPTAAQAFVAIEPDGEKIAQLLESPEEGVRDVATTALVGKTLSRDTTVALGKQLNSDSVRLHINVPAAFAADESVGLADVKINCLLSALSQYKALKDPDKAIRGSIWTKSEIAFRSYVNAMSEIRGAEPVLRRRLKEARAKEAHYNGAGRVQREAIIIALASHKATDVHSQLLAIIPTMENSVALTLAVTALGETGDTADIDLLIELSESDPLKRTDHGRPVYPVRDAARRAIKKIKARLAPAAESVKTGTLEFQSFVLPQIHGMNAERAYALAKALDWESWPKNDYRRVAPRIDKSLLSRPDLVTKELAQYYFVEFDGYVGGTFQLTGRANAKNSHGQFLIQMCLAPSARAAHEYMLAQMISNVLPTQALVYGYARFAKRPPDLGTVSFLRESRKKDDIRIHMVCDNIYVHIRTDGCFAGEALPLARNIDSLIKGQPSLTYGQLMQRTPTITVRSSGTGEWAASYELSIPAGQEIAKVVGHDNGQYASVRDGKVQINNREKGPHRVKLVGITSDLLAATAEKKVIVSE